MITLKQFDGVNITPKDDAILYDFFTNDSGVLFGCTVSHLGANQLKVADGRGMIKGRQFVIEEQTILTTLAESGTLNGRLIIKVDVANTDEPISLVAQAAASLPDLTQEDINATGTVYELPLATYTVGTTQISNLTPVAHTLTTSGTGHTHTQTDITDFTHTHTKTQITDFPASLPANGGNANTVGNVGLDGIFAQRGDIASDGTANFDNYVALGVYRAKGGTLYNSPAGASTTGLLVVFKCFDYLGQMYICASGVRTQKYTRFKSGTTWGNWSYNNAPTVGASAPASPVTGDLWIW